MGSFEAAKFLTRMLSLVLRRDIFFSLGPKKKFSGSFWEHLLVSVAIFNIFAFLCILKNYQKIFNSLRACSGLYEQAEHTGQFLTRILSVRVRNWCVRWAYDLGIGVCTEHMPQVLMCAHSAVPSKHAEHTHQELMRTLSIRVRNWCVQWAYASGTGAHAQRAHQKLNDAKKKNQLSSER